MNKSTLKVPQQAISDFCHRNHIRKISLFGSVLREDFAESSDVDVLVEFDPMAEIGLFDMVRMERELEVFFPGHKVDLRTPEDLSRYFRNQVLNTAEIQYESRG